MVVDINENNILKQYPEVLDILLMDRSSKKNIIWATNNYKKHGRGFFESDYIVKDLVTGHFSRLIKPRVEKGKAEQQKRSKDMAEVFTPSWVCNKQNNLIDSAWFGIENAFNTENDDNSWTKTEKVIFPENKNWIDYVNDNRLEITCGEAPYLVSRYDTVTGNEIELYSRIGLLDRKMRVINENTNDDNWFEYVLLAYQSVYGYDYQGDNVLLARENLLFSFLDYYKDRYHVEPSLEQIKQIAEIISWNIFQMDGMKYVIPMSCHKETLVQMSLFEDMQEEADFCLGCRNGNPRQHNGIYCKIKDWQKNKTLRFIDMIRN